VAVKPWKDPYLDATGFDPRSGYVETYWLPTLGPTATWILRRIACQFEHEPAGFSFDAAEWAQWLGVKLGAGAGIGGRSSFARALNRCVQFGAARLPLGTSQSSGPLGLPSALEVRRRLPPLSATQVNRLPEDLRESHRRAVERGEVRPVVEIMRRQARSIALGLIRLGEDPSRIERQLVQRRFHPSIAHDAAEWASSRSPSSSTLEAAGSSRSPSSSTLEAAGSSRSPSSSTLEAAGSSRSPIVSMPADESSFAVSSSALIQSGSSGSFPLEAKGSPRTGRGGPEAGWLAQRAETRACR